MQNQNEILDYILDRPVELCHKLGFVDMTELHNEWIMDFVLCETDSTLQAHRDSYKSTALSVALAIIILVFPQDTTLFMRKTDSNIKLIIRQVKNILKSDLWQDLSRLLYGRGFELTTDNETSICTDLFEVIQGDNQLDGLGIGSALTSKHYKRVFTDDIITLDDRISKAKRELTKIIYQELQNVKKRGGTIYNVGTPWHKDDCFKLMPKPKKYDCYSTGLMTRAQIEEKRLKLTPSLFAANYELKHIASDGALFNVSPRFTSDITKLYDGIAHIDAAYGGEDACAMTLGRICKDENGDECLYLLGKYRPGHIDKHIENLLLIKNNCRCGTVYVEDNADKGYLKKDIRERGDKASGYHEYTNKYIKISSYLKKWWTKIIFHEDTDPEYISEIMDYTEDAAHDDAPDSAACVCRKLDKAKNNTFYT